MCVCVEYSSVFEELGAAMMVTLYIAQLCTRIWQKESESKELGRFLFIHCPQVERKLPHKPASVVDLPFEACSCNLNMSSFHSY